MRRPGRRAHRVIAGAVAVAVVGVGYAAYAASADDTSYRTATAAVGDVEQTLDLSGSVEPAGRADLSFATSGQIDDIAVEAGDQVKAGRVLGTLDDTGLRKSLQQARATLASARAQLESDEDAQAETVTSSTASSPSTPSVSEGGSGDSANQTPTQTPTQAPTQTPQTPTDDPDDTTTKALLAQLAAQQTAVTTAQSTVSASLTAARDALAAQQTACAAAFTADPTTDPSADPSATPSATPSAEPTADATDQACTDALATVQTAQQQVATDQDALQTALGELATTLTTAVAGLSSGADQPADDQPSALPSTSAPSTSTPSTGTPSTTGPSSGSASGGMTVTAATLARDQAAVDQAKADLVVAQQELRMATVTAPFAGEVVAVDAAEGDSVSSGTAVFVLVSRGTTTVQVAATSAQVQQLAVGRRATATPAGAGQELAGTVTQVSTVPDDASTYPVTITLARKHLDIATGLSASVSVVTGTATDVVTVPASAVSDGTVTVRDGDSIARTRVTTGVVGATTVEVTDGLEAGDVVVLADLEQALPTSDESTNQRGGFGGGGFGGNGGPPAGMGGGGAPMTFTR